MFTGIIEGIGKVLDVQVEGTNKRITLECEFLDELKVDQSLCHNGVCLTVEKINSSNYEVVAIKETLEKSNLGRLEVGDFLNLERSLQANGRLDGHVVQGHVDTVGLLSNISEENGSWYFSIELKDQMDLLVEKGSVALNGVSLTIAKLGPTGFQVAIIPYTYEHTNFHDLAHGAEMNIEFDILGKYVKRIVSFK